MADLTRFIEQLGYLNFALRVNVAICSPAVEHDPAAWNHAFVPADRLDVFRAACSAHGIALARPF